VGRKRKKDLPIYESVEIIDIAAEGKAIAKVNDVVIFVEGVIPGDVVDIQVTKKRRRFQEARVISFQKKSEERAEVFCEHFGVCGGCKWQILPYKKQLEFKEKQCIDQLTRIGHLEIQEKLPILGSSQTEFYRNKLEFTFSNKRWKTYEEVAAGTEITDNNALGFHIPRLFDKIVDVKKCYLQGNPSNSIRNFIRDFALENDFTYFDIREHHGLLRNLIIRNTLFGELMVIVIFYEDNTEQRTALMDAVKDKFPEITSLMYVVNQKANDTIGDQDVVLYNGNDHIFEEMEGLKFKIGPKSFYQTNSAQAYELYKVAREFAQLESTDLVYDLYTGTGTIANFVAKQAKQVIGIEYVPEAIEDAHVNSEINKIENTLFYAGDMKDVLNDEFITKHGNPDVIITDPPRAGMHADVIDTIKRCAPKRVVYVSCNPATQARDIDLMQDMYTLVKTRAVDMFPHTHHVENVVLLEKK